MSYRFPSIHRDNSPFPIVPDGMTNPRVKRIGSAIRAVCDVTELQQNQVLSPTRIKRFVHARQLVCWIAYRCTDKSLPEIGKRMGFKDHTTVWHGIGMTELRIKASSTVARTAEAAIRRAIELDEWMSDPIVLQEVKAEDRREVDDAAECARLSALIADLRAKNYTVRTIAAFTKAPYEFVAKEVGLVDWRVQQ